MGKFRMVAGAAVAAALCLGALTAGAAEFSADVIMERMGQTMQGKMYFKEKKVRQEMTDPNGQKRIMIILPEESKMLMLDPAQKTVLTLPITGGPKAMAYDPAEMEKLGTRKKLGTETVNGYVCDKFLFTFKDPAQGSMTIWESRKLKMPIRMHYPGGPGGGVKTEFRNIKTGGVSDKMFETPAGYQAMQMPQMPNMEKMMEQMKKRGQ